MRRAVAHHRNSELAAGGRWLQPAVDHCFRSGVIDASKLPALARDCVHMVVNNDPGLKALSGVRRLDASESRALPGCC